MTKKRFEPYYNDHKCFEHWTVKNNKTGIMYPMTSQNIAKDIANLLNALHEENEQLKSDLDYFKAKNGSLETGMFNLERENEKLKSICKDHRDHAIDFKADCVRLEKKNVELKLLVQGWEALDEEKDGQLDKQNQALKKLKEENEQLKKQIENLKSDLKFAKMDSAINRMAQRPMKW